MNYRLAIIGKTKKEQLLQQPQLSKHKKKKYVLKFSIADALAATVYSAIETTTDFMKEAAHEIMKTTGSSLKATIKRTNVEPRDDVMQIQTSDN
ncbi:unknown protein [Seminavis robusta]|uniref:Uncharacterized protein n=1 Tax=Seminavis robusta TaxID=568900 RepID=A0A9N8EMN1_9STRA|nr:unknown protein [Seminavis robusta]|eukprot:Sro1345_g264750.1 n/a (94) ;mRNA; r:5942-6223